VSTLPDFIDVETLRRLQDSIAQMADVPICICHPNGQPLFEQGYRKGGRGRLLPPAGGESLAYGLLDVPVIFNKQVVGRIRLASVSARETAGKIVEAQPWVSRFLTLMADGISMLCDRELQLRERVEELATLYRLTAEFTGQHDLQRVLDVVARTVVAVLKAKACSIRLLSEDHTELLVKAVHNLSPEYLDKGPILVTKSQIDRDVLASGRPVYIADERTDPRVLYKAQARREGIVSALCAPLVYRGHPEGVVHVYTAQPHEFDWFEVSLLQAVATQAAAAIVNARLYEEAVRSAAIQRQLNLAADVQRQMIPHGPPQVQGFDIAAVYVPCFELGGDFYDFIDLPESNLGIAVCDVVGKGIRASLLMASIRASLRAHAMNVYDMSEVLAKVNRDLCADALTSDFATLFYGVLDARSRRFTYANAGHTPPLLFRDGQTCHLATGGGVIGIDPQGHWGHDSMICHGGDVIVAYTDGLSEAMNFDDEPFGRQRIEKAAQAAIVDGKNANGIVQHLLWEMRRFAGLQTRFDDLTIIAIKAL